MLVLMVSTSSQGSDKSRLMIRLARAWSQGTGAYLTLSADFFKNMQLLGLVRYLRGAMN